jgi:PLP dependent protein
MREICFLQVAFESGIFPGAFGGYQALRFGSRDAQINDQIFHRKAVDLVLETPQPLQEFLAASWLDPRALMRQVGRDVAVRQHQVALRQRRFHLWPGFQTITGVEQGGKMRVHLFQRAEIAVQVARHEAAEKAVVARETQVQQGHAAPLEGAHQHLHLGAFARAVNPFESDEFSAWHENERDSLARDRSATYRRRALPPGWRVLRRRVVDRRARIRAMPDFVEIVAANLMRVREQIARAVERSGRHASDVTLAAVTKTFPAEAIRAAYEAGLRHFGENRVQEWEEKRAQVGDLQATWHLIGHLQSNKARRAAAVFHSVDSVDSIALAQKLDAAAAEIGKRLPVLIEVRLDLDAPKSGVAEEDLRAVVETVLGLAHLELRGLMGVPPYFQETEKVRPFFRKLRELRDGLREQLRLGFDAQSGPASGDDPALDVLSMGMSHDFEVAIEEGATEVRLGSALFGTRAPGA